jgi:hypothetical protein
MNLIYFKLEQVEILQGFFRGGKECYLNAGLPACYAGTVSLEPHHQPLNNQRKLGKALEHVGIGNHFLNKSPIPYSI